MSNFDLFVASSKTEKEIASIELDHYLEEYLIIRKSDFNVLSWWKTTLKYPTLQLIAGDILPILVSTVALE